MAIDKSFLLSSIPCAFTIQIDARSQVQGGKSRRCELVADAESEACAVRVNCIRVDRPDLIM